jgi:hypothetical protein
MSDTPLATAGGGLVITEAALAAIPEARRAQVQKIAADYGRRIVEQVRKDNESALALLRDKGRLRSMKLDRAGISTAAKSTWPRLAAGLDAKAELEAATN